MNSEQNNPEVSGSVKKSNETDPPVKPAPEPVEELERRLVEKTRELNEIEARFATFMSYLPAAAFIKDTSGRTLYANKFLQTLLNFQNWEGKTSPELVSGESGQRMLEDDRKALAEGPIRIQETMTVADGRRRNFETIKFPIPVQGKSMLLGGIAIDVTERKRAEEALSEQLDFNQRVFNSTDAHLVVVGADGTILDINAAWRRFAKENQGMDESKWGLGASFFVPYDKEWGDTAMASEAFEGIRKVQLGLLPYFSVEYPCNSSGGEKRWFDMRVLPLQGKDGKVLVSHTNITELKRAEESMRFNEHLIKSASVAICACGLEGNMLSVNPCFLQVWGFENEAEIIGRHFWDFWMVEERLDKIMSALHSEGFWSDEIKARRKNGSLFDVYVRANVVLDSKGKPTSLMSTSVDITERKRVEEAMGRNQAMLARTESIANVGSWEWDMATDTVTWSNELFHIFQRNPDDGAPSFSQHQELYHPEDMQRLRVAVDASIINGTPYEMELRAIRKDGETRVCLARGYAEMDPGKRVKRLFGSLQDITERKQTEVQREKLEVQNRQLQKSESLGRMAGAIAHHFNNQLQVVMMNLDFALRSKSSGEFPTENLTGAMQSARKAAEVSTLMLTYLGQTQGKLQLLDFPNICHQSLPMLRASIPKDVVLETDFPCFGPVINGNADQIQQVLINLVTNAWEASLDGRGVVRIAVKVVSVVDIPAINRFPIYCQIKDSDYACLEVADEGCGISAQDIEKLFEPFFSSKFTGRGLGLPVVLGIVRVHQGVITVESEPGRGSVFRVFFPLSLEAIPQKPVPVVQGSKTAGNGTVLVVDDEITLRKVVTTAIKGMGFTVLDAIDGVHAVEVFRQHQDEICLVLCDLTMPRMDGWQTLEALRNLAPSIPVILSSGYSEAQVMAGNHPELPQAFLSKPYEYEKLSEAVFHVLNRKEGW